MPLITSSSGFQIHGGNFYDVSGDMNIHSTQSVIGLSNDPLTVLESGLTASSRRLVGPQRNGRQIEAARMMPYGHRFKSVPMDLVISYHPQRRYHYFQAHPRPILSGERSNIPPVTIKTAVVRRKVIGIGWTPRQSLRDAEPFNFSRPTIKTGVRRREMFLSLRIQLGTIECISISAET
ncbi:hypothetical protein MSAN_02455900 [Mycena sanguinolenta]|uniref:Uncharacterized protein n=1 Tax=Mycena sanguinolenta TaxID=230812 RepID=A0A8H6WXX1_9AGAR|nr:hypothetical protein MSAN_02455900 [Mycena sanguinolenta]